MKHTLWWIAFHVPFNDYNENELCDIAGLIADKYGIHLSDDAMDKLKMNFTTAKENSDFGNGRYVRNVIEKNTGFSILQSVLSNRV